MKLTDFDAKAVTTALEQVSVRFHTRDASEHRAMLAAHSKTSDRNYHAMVGSYLSRNRRALGLRLLPECESPRGACWEKTASAPLGTSGPPAMVTPPVARGEPADVGPQCDDDGAFKARMRFHQSFYRANVLRVACGTGPTAGSLRRYGNMLTREDGAAGRNFLTPAIHEVAKRRVEESSDRVDPFRLMHNMLSSQPMCFNLFGPLAVERERAGRLLAALFPGEIARVHEVTIEYAPSPASEYLADRTSFDAFIDYERDSGERAFIAVETKLTDSFSPERYDGAPYRRWMNGARMIWRDDDERVVDPSHNQVWRIHLLAIALRDRPGSPYVAGRSVVVRHPLDESGASAVAGYRALLRGGDREPTFGEITLDVVADAFEKGVTGDDERAWIASFRARYVSMEGSEAAWVERPAKRLAGIL
jgi:hypothetical protein